jgi:hypothetical protein
MTPMIAILFIFQAVYLQSSFGLSRDFSSLRNHFQASPRDWADAQELDVASASVEVLAWG